MSNFKQTLNELYLAGYFEDKYEARKLASQYDKSTPEKKAALDKHALLILEKKSLHNRNQKDLIYSIKNNLQFIAWVFIISIGVSVIGALAVAFDS